MAATRNAAKARRCNGAASMHAARLLVLCRLQSGRKNGGNAECGNAHLGPLMRHAVPLRFTARRRKSSRSLDTVVSLAPLGLAHHRLYSSAASPLDARAMRWRRGMRQGPPLQWCRVHACRQPPCPVPAAKPQEKERPRGMRLAQRLCTATGRALRTRCPRDAVATRNAPRPAVAMVPRPCMPPASLSSAGCKAAGKRAATRNEACTAIVHGHGPCTQDERPARYGGDAKWCQRPAVAMVVRPYMPPVSLSCACGKAAGKKSGHAE